MRTLALLLLLVPGIAAAQLPGVFGDLLRNLPKPGAQPAQPQQAAPATPGLFSETSEQEEIQIGRQLAGNLLGAAPLVKDERLQRYVNRVGRWVASQGERAGLQWYFGVLDSEHLNAFALPGGYVFLTKGLFDLLGDEAELAGVLGHEIAHVMLQHHLKVLKQSQGIELVGGIIGSQVAQRDTYGARQLLLGKGAEALTRGLDKGAEFEADQVGIVLATRAGYAPYGLPSVLRKMGARNPQEATLSLLFKTHPLPQERLEKLGDAMGDSFDRFAAGRTLPERLKRLD
ncbi:MAG TPA: M48 family metalloprotease [Burkholderiales bacterium]|nr:M48 family metalloprotease [Burkholderiales bacterium]